MNSVNLLSKTFLVLAMTASALTVSAAPAKNSEASCKGCQSADTLAKDLSKLDYNLDADKDKGGLKALEAVEKLESFQKIKSSDPQRAELFKSLVKLSREAAPYDGESQLSQILAAISLKDASLKKTLDSEVSAMPKAAGSSAKCKTELFESRLNEATCLKKAKVIGQQPMGQKQVAEAKSCTETFNYGMCLKSAK